jgi:apolipoprotein N-acyltransferase
LPTFPCIFAKSLKKQILLILLAPALLTLGWPPLPTGFLLFCGFLPLFILENEAKRWFGSKVYISILLWNIGTTWWVWNASPEGCIAMLLANSYLMHLVFRVYRRVKRFYGLKTGLIAFIISWLSFEYLHLNWDLTYPWLNLGNGMAALPQFIQWYEFTGTLGGTFWILVVNCLIFLWYLNPIKSTVWKPISAIAAPILISAILWFQASPNKNSKTYEVVVVQPNIDPYQKFNSSDSEAEVNYFTKMAERKTKPGTEFLLFPETAITEYSEERYINNTVSQTLLRDWLQKFPDLTLVAGTNTFRFFDPANKPATARKNNSGEYYDVYNATTAINKDGVNAIYRKSKLVPGVEKMPYPSIFSFLETYSIDLGGISGSLGQDSFARVFYSKNKIGAAPLICYESIFGEYVSTFVQKGAQVIFVLTNDGWWGNTPGYRHHKLYARLRAIENRREVVRCTNTGTSCHIDKRGTITGETPWWETAVMNYSINAETNLTFYTKYGDYLGKFAAILFAFIFIMLLGGSRLSKKILKNNSEPTTS